MFAAKKTPKKKRIQLGIVPIALIAGGLFGSVYGSYVYLEITPPTQRFWYSAPPQPPRVAAPAITPAAPPAPVAVATAPALVPFAQPATVAKPPVNTPPVAEIEKPSIKEASHSSKPQAKRSAEPRAAKPTKESNTAVSIQHQPEPDSIDLILANAYQSYQSGDFETASKQYREALAKEPRNRDALLGLAAIAQQQAQDDTAVLYYRRVLSLDPRDPVAQAALTSFGPGDPASKENRLNQLVTQQPESAALQYALGNQFADQSRWAEAQQSYFNALELEPNNALFAFSVAISLDHIGQRSTAAQYYQQALQLDKTGNSGFNRDQAQQRLNKLTSH